VENLMLASPRRLIEVDLPITRISAHARREKSIRHGHISTLHIWWARRPLAACRAVICAALWPDPADEHCPPSFRDAAARQLIAFAKRVNPERITDEKHKLQETLSPESRARWEVLARNDPPLDPADPAHQNALRFALLDFIADFANWDNSTVPAYLETSRALTQAAHEALGGEPGTRPLVVDPFAYLWARTIRCKGAGCVAEVPLMRSLWLARKANRLVALKLVPNVEAKRVDFQIVSDAKAKEVCEGTVKRGSGTCPCCGYTTLEWSESIVEVKGDKARLLPVAERTKHLFGKDTDAGSAGGKKAKKKPKQPSLFAELDEAEEAGGGWKELKGPPPGATVLDRLHQAMILFGAQRGELLKRFLVEDGAGKDARFWKLAQPWPPSTRPAPTNAARSRACWRARRAWGYKIRKNTFPAGGMTSWIGRSGSR
jgi:hypothetical protein